MSEASSDSAVLFNVVKNPTRELWLGTFYFTVNLYDLKNSRNPPYIRNYRKPIFIDFLLEFHFERTSELNLKITCTRVSLNNSIPNGDYKMQFYCDIFAEGSKMFEMQSSETVAGVDFSLRPIRKNSLLGDYWYSYDIKILINLIEYDVVRTNHHIVQRDLFFEKNKLIFSNESVLNDLCCILSVLKLEDIFTGRQNLQFLFYRSRFIERASAFSKEIATYMKCKNGFTTPPFIDAEFILNYILHEKSERISDKDLVNVYEKAHYFGLVFLLELATDAILDRLAQYEISSLEMYEDFMFIVVQAAVEINDEGLYVEASERFNIERYIFNSQHLFKRFERSSTSSKFVISFTEQRLRNLESDSSSGSDESTSSSTQSNTDSDNCSGNGEASSSNVNSDSDSYTVNGEASSSKGF